jgi:FkbH-like protein
LLPLLDHEAVTRALAARGTTTNCDAAPREPLPVAIAATFTAEPVATSLKLWSQAFGIPVRVTIAGYNQVQQELLGADRLFHRIVTGLNVVLARPEDLLSDAGVDSTGAADSLLDATERFARDANGSLVVATLPPAVSQVTTADRSAVESLRARWRQRLTEIDGVEVVDFAAVFEQIGLAAAGRSDLEIVARSPYSPQVFQELGIELARLVRRRRVALAKVLALDADGVLWGGVLAEDGRDGIQIGPDHPGRSFQLFQRQILQLKQRGVLLVLVSRNEPEDVFRVLDEHPGMLIRREDITAARINRRPKSESLRELATELGLGLDSFVFVDDDAANRLEVARHAPQVTVLPLPTDPALYCRTLSRLWRFDTPRVTDEDRLRSTMVRQEQQRQHERETAGDLESYLQSLQLRVRMRVAGAADLPRLAQLTQKTNQFNTSLRRRDLAEIKSLGPQTTIYVVEASDKFGDYGLVGVAILRSNGEHFELDTLLMSLPGAGTRGRRSHAARSDSGGNASRRSFAHGTVRVRPAQPTGPDVSPRLWLVGTAGRRLHDRHNATGSLAVARELDGPRNRRRSQGGLSASPDRLRLAIQSRSSTRMIRIQFQTPPKRGGRFAGMTQQPFRFADVEPHLGQRLIDGQRLSQRAVRFGNLVGSEEFDPGQLPRECVVTPFVDGIAGQAVEARQSQMHVAGRSHAERMLPGVSGL